MEEWMDTAINVEGFYEKYFPLVVRRCRQLLVNEDDAMDAAQDVFINLMRSRNRLRGDFPSSLLYTMATNTSLNFLRRKRRRRETGDAPEDGLLSCMDRSFDCVEAKILTDAILNAESEKTRVICLMYHGDGMTLEEIGKTLGMSFSGVRKRLESFQKRARIKLEKGDTV
ncbi:MAG: sigma-70 family RNA polymerase sigma factor [Treponema sp.]|jgi:RNA polymerase sigma-70 factor (ECF subfamily)|nr:sigma-70 family RNA polymerase sigma factor [Treponema sp.]